MILIDSQTLFSSKAIQQPKIVALKLKKNIYTNNKEISLVRLIKISKKNKIKFAYCLFS